MVRAMLVSMATVAAVAGVLLLLARKGPLAGGVVLLGAAVLFCVLTFAGELVRMFKGRKK
jgi:hypothetical protein